MTSQQELAVRRLRNQVSQPDAIQVLDDRPDDHGQKQSVTVFLQFTGLYLTYDWTGNLVKTESKAQRLTWEKSNTATRSEA